MAVKKKRARRGPTAAIELIVRRGALRRFDKLKRAAATLPVQVSWDRRAGDKSSTPKGAERERRHAPPFTWDVADFVVVEKRGGRRRSTKRRL